jgi:hypothetical protein
MGKQVSSSGICHFIEPMKYCRDLSQQKIKRFEMGTSHPAKAGQEDLRQQGEYWCCPTCY